MNTQLKWVEVSDDSGTCFWINPERVRYIVELDNGQSCRLVFDEHDFIEACMSPEEFIKLTGIYGSVEKESSP
jgi:hypothetical protein